MTYDTSGLNAATSWLDILIAINIASNGLLGVTLLVIVLICATFACYNKYDFLPALVAGTLITSVVSMLFFFLEITTKEIMFMFIVLFFLLFGAKIWMDRR